MSGSARNQDRRWAEYVAGLQSGPMPRFDEQLATYQRLFATRRAEDGPPVVWAPGPDMLEQSNLVRFMNDLGMADYASLHRWSVADRPAFWQETLDRLGIVLKQPWTAIVDGSGGPEHPRWLPGATLNIVESCFTAPPDRVAVVSGRQGTRDLVHTTFGELQELVERTATRLGELGFGPQDRIALYMPMDLTCVATYLAIVRMGALVVSVADSFSASELARRLELAGATGVITVACHRRGTRTVDLYAKVCEADAARAVVITGGSRALRLRARDVLCDDLLGPATGQPAASCTPDRITNVLFSSGTTGDPKAIPWTHLTPIKCSMDGHFHQDIRLDDVVAWPTSIGWMMGPWLIYASLINGAAIALYEGLPSSEGFVRFVADAGVTMLGVVPSLVRTWRGSPRCADVEWGSIRVFSSTGEPSGADDYLWLMSRARYRAPIIEYCGGTEIGGGYITGSVVQPASPSTFTTPALGIDVIVLADDGSPALDGEMGEVFLVPPSIGLSQHLHNRDHHEVYHAGTPTGIDGQVLRRHGDQMVRLPGGYFQALGRADDTMNLGGIKTSSRELEAVVNDHPAVFESAAIGASVNSSRAEHLVLYVVPSTAVDVGRLRTELRTLIARRLNPLFKVHDVVMVESLPRTASNKLMRRELRADYDRRQRSA